MTVLNCFLYTDSIMLLHQVAAVISEVMLVYMDRLRSKEIGLERKLERERKRTQRYTRWKRLKEALPYCVQILMLPVLTLLPTVPGNVVVVCFVNYVPSPFREELG